ncbi:MAG TPA: hypothetical protein VK453_05665 [Micromonosporaceae bacterium]|nr:hypothetical protein [Micromonosporaceae bacterium]
MFAIIAAVLFGLALLLSLIGQTNLEVITPTNLLYAGLLFLALQFTSVASYRGRRPGRG